MNRVKKTLLQEVEGYDLSKITTYFCHKNNVEPNFGIKIENEFKRFVYLIANENKSYGMAGIVDDYWHTFILCSLEYHEFCEHLGVGYIHHSPDFDNSDAEESATAYSNFFEDYKSEFSTSPPMNIWPANASNCKNSCKGSPHCKNSCKGSPHCKNTCKGGPHPSRYTLQGAIA